MNLRDPLTQDVLAFLALAFFLPFIVALAAMSGAQA